MGPEARHLDGTFRGQIPALRAHREADLPPCDPEGTGSQDAQETLVTTFRISPKSTKNGEAGTNDHNGSGFKQPTRRQLVSRLWGTRPREEPLTGRTVGGPSIAAPAAAGRGTAHAPRAGRGRQPCAPRPPRAPPARPPATAGPACAARPLAAVEEPCLRQLPKMGRSFVGLEVSPAGIRIRRSLVLPTYQPQTPVPTLKWLPGTSHSSQSPSSAPGHTALPRAQK